MSSKSFVLSVWILILHSSSFLVAQVLPSGAEHRHRDRTIDIQHYKADLKFQFEEGRIDGISTISFSALRATEIVTLDAINISIEKVFFGGQQLKFKSSQSSVEIFFDQPLLPGKNLEISITFHCFPKGGVSFHVRDGKPQEYFVSTYGEGGLHANWLPIYNELNDRFSSEMILTVPKFYVAISNGSLLSQKELADGVVFHWKQELSHPNYLMTFYIGPLVKGELPSSGKVPVAYWVPEGQQEQASYVFRNTARMIDFYSKLFNYPYPWEKYDQITMPDYAPAAMEHTGAVGHDLAVLRGPKDPVEYFLGFDEYASEWTAESVIAHELAHHWFGNNLTGYNLSYIWMHESFVSYLMMVWDKELEGEDKLLFDVFMARNHYLDYARSAHIIRPLEYRFFDNRDAIFDIPITYIKGAAVMHMLNRILGDEDFYRSLSHYLKKHEFQNVQSQDLKIAIEEATGRNLHWFFDQWITGGGHPQFEVGYRYLPRQKLIDLSVSQVQPIVEGQGLFSLPVEITIATEAGTRKENIQISEARHNFLIPCETPPLMVSFDGVGALVADIDFPKEIEELKYQAIHDALPGRMRAIHQLASNHPTNPETCKLFLSILESNAFWGIKAEVALKSGLVRTVAAQKVVEKALKEDEYHIRKAAILALLKFDATYSEKVLKEIILNDPHTDVVATAIYVLGQVNPTGNTDLIRKQLQRESWFDEILIASLQAFGFAADPELIPTIKPYTSSNYNQDVRAAALQAWENANPSDPELHQLYIKLTRSPAYKLQGIAIGKIGELLIEDGVEALNNIIEFNADANHRVAAHSALSEIERVQKALSK